MKKRIIWAIIAMWAAMTIACWRGKDYYDPKPPTPDYSVWETPEVYYTPVPSED